MSMINKKVLMLGGTGAMGVYLAPKLAEMGYEVYITSRSEKESDNERIHFIKGNAKDWNFAQTLLVDKYDAIVDFMVYKTPEFAERYEAFLNSTEHYIFLSSYRVYGDNHGKPICETSPRLLDSVQDEEYLATDEYGLTKARQENLLVGAKKKNWTVLRPAITYSTTRFQLGTMEANEFLYRVLNEKKVIFPKQMMEKEATMSWAGDVADMMAKIVLNEKAMGEIFTVSTAEHHKWGEVLEYYKKLVGLEVKIVDLEVYKKVIGRLWQIKYDRMFDRVVDNSKILAVTGMKQEDMMPLYDGLKMELENFVKNPTYNKIDQVMQKNMDAVIASETEKVVVKQAGFGDKVKKLFSKDLTLQEKVSKVIKFIKK